MILRLATLPVGNRCVSYENRPTSTEADVLPESQAAQTFMRSNDTNILLLETSGNEWAADEKNGIFLEIHFENAKNSKGRETRIIISQRTQMASNKEVVVAHIPKIDREECHRDFSGCINHNWEQLEQGNAANTLPRTLNPAGETILVHFWNTIQVFSSESSSCFFSSFFSSLNTIQGIRENKLTDK